jgi:hypothetical protein
MQATAVPTQVSPAQDAAAREYVRSVARSDDHGTADGWTRLAGLSDRGVISAAKFRQSKAKALF